MKTEFEKVRSQELANISDPEVFGRQLETKSKVHRLNMTDPRDHKFLEYLVELIPTVSKSTTLVPPFYCDYGDGIILGKNVFINSGCTFLDGAYITIGDYTLIGPNVQIFTPQHPMDSVTRRQPVEYAFPVTIGKDCWIGGGVIICPGVTIGDKCIIGAGSVVTKDIPANSMAVGNPARVIRSTL